MEFKHKSVLLDETVGGLNIKPDGIYVDGTLGGAGHAIEVCRKLSAKGRFIGIDQDQDAIIAASERLAAFDQVTIIRSNYCYMVQELAARGIHKVDGIVLDLGVSSYQLDNEERGFTYRVDAPLDMRMDQRQTQTASDIVNGYEERELYRIIRDYGEDKFAKNIAKHIVAARQQSPIMTTGQLTQIIRESIPMKIQAAGGHPAKRTFQAIRIELNKELDVLRDSLDGMIDLLDDGGRLCIITFHSLEDRIVKTIFRKMRIRVPVHRIFRYVCAERNPRGELSQGSQFFQVMKKWKKTRVLRVLSLEFLKKKFKRRVKNGGDRQTYKYCVR